MSASMNFCEFKQIVPNLDIDGTKTEPEPRSGHRIIVTDSNLYSIGGYNPDFWEYENVTDDTYYPLFKELWKFNFITKRWTKLNTNGHMPLELASHSACLHKNNLVVYGGTGIPFGEASSNNIHICNLTSLNWKNLTTQGNSPTPGYGSVIHAVGKYIYVFGGTTGWEYNSDIHRLDLETCIWEKIEAEGSPPEGRYRHETVYHDNKLYIFGGGRALSVFTLEELPVFNFDSYTWDYIPCKPDPDQGFPKARRCHSCVLLKDDVYVCGGYNGEDIYGDLWKINLQDFRWKKISAQLKQPCYFHSSAVAPNGSMYTFGGVIKLDVERTSAVTVIPLCVPSLRELAWKYVADSIPNIECIQHEHLRQLGIPVDLIKRRL